MAVNPSLRGALATKQSSFSFRFNDGLLRGACHRARIRATRWLAMTGRGSRAPHFPTHFGGRFSENAFGPST